MDMKLNPRTGAMVAVLALLGGYSVYTNVLSGPDVPARSTTVAPAPVAPDSPLAAANSAQPRPARAPARARTDEWRPVVLPKRPEDRPDPTKIDPTLQWWRFEKVQQVPPAGGARNLFQFGTAPPPKPVLVASAEPTVRPHLIYGPKAPVQPGPPPPPPPPPPVPLKFYGWSTTTAAGKRMGYFMDGEEILLAGEGDTLKRRYKIVQIGPSSAVIEDLDVKRQQSVPLAAEGQG